MAEDNITTIRKAYVAFNRGNIPAVLTMLSADVDWYTPEELPYGGSCWGPAEVVAALGHLAETFEEYRLEVEEVLPAGADRVLVLGRSHAAVRGATTVAGFAHVWTLHEGKARTYRNYTDTGKLLALLRHTPTTPADPGRAAPAFDPSV